MSKNVIPIFIFSLPRSGSTLVQRVLGSHPNIATCAEPWILLPFVYPFEKDGAISEYGYKECQTAMREFVSALAGGKEAYLNELSRFILALYQRVTSNEEYYFLDKTPRYHLIAKEIIEIFPNAKFIFLWRNPLSVIASSIMTWGKKDQWNIHKIKVDLYKGTRNLISAYKEHEDHSISIRFEDLLTNELKWKQLFDYLDLHFTGRELDDFSKVDLPGRMGDPSGVKAYSVLDRDPIEKWKTVLDSPLRKWWCKKYLRTIGSDALMSMGYDFTELSETLERLPNRYSRVPFDVAAIGYGMLFSLIELNLLKDKLTNISSYSDIVGYH